MDREPRPLYAHLLPELAAHPGARSAVIVAVMTANARAARDEAIARERAGERNLSAEEELSARLLVSAQRVEALERELATERGLHQHTATLHEQAVAEIVALERAREEREAEQREQLRLIEADIALAAQRADEERAKVTAERDMWLASSREHATQRNHATRHMMEARRERDEARRELERLTSAAARAMFAIAATFDEARSQRDLAMHWGLAQTLLAEAWRTGAEALGRRVMEARDALRRLHRDMGGDDRERRQALDDSARPIAQWGGDDDE